MRPFDVPNSDVVSEYECKACQYTLPQTEQSYLEFLFDGTYDTTTHVFTPALSYNGGFTPTVALEIRHPARRHLYPLPARLNHGHC